MRERCSALIANRHGQALVKRASGSQDLRCQRLGRRKVDGEWFCYAHQPEAWKVHDAIVRRIRAL